MTEKQPPVEHFPTAERLHTDVLEDKYGPISAKVVRHDNQIREVHLVDHEGISRTYAITFFPNSRFPEEVQNINEEIKSGTPIGKAFRNHGYEIRKNVIDVLTVDIPTRLKEEFHTEETTAKARLSEFYAKKGNEPALIYGTVAEIYSPDFREPVINSTDIGQIHPATESLNKLGITKDEIWEKLGNEARWDTQLAQDSILDESNRSIKESLEQKTIGYLNQE